MAVPPGPRPGSFLFCWRRPEPLWPRCAASRLSSLPPTRPFCTRCWAHVQRRSPVGAERLLFSSCSFCLCLNRAWDRTETLETGTGAPLLLSTASSLGPLQLQDLPRGLCVYLDPQEADRLGSSGPLHFQYKQARLQALETMANVLKQRIDILTTKLREAEAPDAALDWLHERPSSLPTVLTLTAEACPGTLMPNRKTGMPQDWAGLQAQPLVPSSCFLSDDPQLWSPSWEPQSLGLRAHHQGQPQGRTGALGPMASGWPGGPMSRSAGAHYQLASSLETGRGGQQLGVIQGRGRVTVAGPPRVARDVGHSCPPCLVPRLDKG